MEGGSNGHCKAGVAGAGSTGPGGSILDDLRRTQAETCDAADKFRGAGMVAGRDAQAEQGAATGGDVADGGADDAGGVVLRSEECRAG